MWEMGVATAPSVDHHPRIIVFAFGSDLLPLYTGYQLYVDGRDARGLTSFTQDFLTTPGFFPGHADAVASDLSPGGSHVQAAAYELVHRLDRVVPPKDKGFVAPPLRVFLCHSSGISLRCESYIGGFERMASSPGSTKRTCCRETTGMSLCNVPFAQQIAFLSACRGARPLRPVIFRRRYGGCSRSPRCSRRGEDT